MEAINVEVAAVIRTVINAIPVGAIDMIIVVDEMNMK